jgi:mRNA export factor
MRTPNPVSTVQLPERCYTLDVSYPLMVVGTAERHVQIFNLTNPTTPFKTMMSPLKWQTRVISCFPNGTGFAMGSVEGRVAIQYVDEKDSQNNFSFKCHRRDQSPTTKDQSLVFAVNDINFHPIHGTFSTCGSDGTINFWDKDSRTRLKTFDPRPGPVSSSAFSRNGSIFAYAVSYDWSKGHSGNTPGHPNKLMLHPVKEDEVKKRTQKR